MDTPRQFSEIINQNFPKCPGCNRNPITSDSPVSRVDNKTKVCISCKGGELSRDQDMLIDPASLLNDKGSTEDLLESYYPAKAQEKVLRKALSDESFHSDRIKNSEVPVPEETKAGKWRVSYGKNSHTGEIEAYAHAPETSPSAYLAHDAILDHPSGKVSFQVRGTYLPPVAVQNHIRSVLTKHWRQHVAGK